MGWFTNSFNNSRNFFTQQEIEQGKIDEFFKKTLARIEKGLIKKQETNTDVSELLKRIEILERKVALLEGKQSYKKEAKNTDQFIDDDRLHPNIVAQRIEAERKSMMNKGYVKEDYAELLSIKKNAQFKTEEELEKALTDFRANIDEKLEQRRAEALNTPSKLAEQTPATQAQNATQQQESQVLNKFSPKPVETDPNDSTEMDSIRNEYKANAKQSSTSRQPQRMNKVAG